MKKKIAVLFLSCALCGCSSFTDSNAPNAGLYYPLCYSPLQQARRLDSRAREVAEGMGRGLIGGALAGLAGGAVSALFTGDPLNLVSGMAIGAAGGTVAGGLAGGTDSNQAEKTALIAEWSQEAGTPLEGLGFNGAAATWSIQCYNTRLSQLNREIDDGIVTRQAAEPRMVEIELGRQEAYALLNGTQN